MSNGIAHNNLNDISKIYLETISDINKKEQESDVKRWQQEDAKYGYDKKGRSLNPKDIKKRKMKEEAGCETKSPFRKNIFNIGDMVESLNTGLVGEIIRRGTNYLISVTEDNMMFKSWTHDLSEYTEKHMERRMRDEKHPNM